MSPLEDGTVLGNNSLPRVGAPGRTNKIYKMLQQRSLVSVPIGFRTVRSLVSETSFSLARLSSPRNMFFSLSISCARLTSGKVAATISARSMIFSGSLESGSAGSVAGAGRA